MTQDKSDTSLIALSDPLTALSLLSRLPLPATDDARASEAAWAYPLVGFVIGALAAVIGAVAHGLGLPAALCALLALTALVMLTGAMHEDGLADMADGLWGGWDREARLEIMRDSRIGTYGVVALVLSLSARFAALWLLFESGPALASAALVGSGTLSRAAMPVLMAALPHAREDGLSHRVGRVTGLTASIAVAVASIIAVLTIGAGFFWAFIWGALVAFALAMIAKRKISGQTGDILGASQQLVEITVLFVLLA